MQWWHWIVAGFALCLCELAVPAFVLIWLGISALVLGLLTAIIPMSLAMQISVWSVLSIILVVLWLRVFRSRDKSTRAGTSDSAIGEVGLLVREVMPFQPGEVLFQRPLLGSDRWSCVSTAKLGAGSRVRVVKVEGNTLMIEAA